MQCARCEQIGRTIPSDIAQCLEMIRNLRNGSRDDSVVERNEEDRQTQRDDNDHELEARGIDDFIVRLTWVIHGLDLVHRGEVLILLFPI